MWLASTVLFGFLLDICFSDCDIYGTIESDFWLTESEVPLSGCPGSYFQLDIKKVDTTIWRFNYEFDITEPNFGNLLVINNEIFLHDLHLASHTEDLVIVIEGMWLSCKQTADLFQKTNRCHFFQKS